jgi:hypothetical protein
MSGQRFGTMKNASLLRTRTAGFCVLVGLAIFVLVVTAGLLGSKAQAPALPVANSSAGVNIQALDEQTKQRSGDSSKAERKKQIGDDCAKLLELATGLKSEVDKSTKDTLSVTVIRKAGEIEQLARKMRDEMKPASGKN